MGFLDFFQKRTATKPPAAQISNEELKSQIFDCIYRNNLVEFENLCHENEDQILRSFADWKRAPVEVQKDKDDMRKYAYSLMVIASYFQKQHNNGDLMTMLTGIDDTEYSKQWQEQLGHCRTLMQEQLNFDEAIPLLEKCLELTSGVSGAGVDKFLPLTLGFLGECYFHKAEPAKAAEYVERALQCTSMQGDYDATFAYRSNLYEIYRYMGEAKKAAEYAEAVAAKAYDRGDLVTASNWRHHARSAAGSEPLYRIVIKIGDELFELDEIPKVYDERIEFIFARNRLELVLCTHKCNEAREVAQAGNFEKALEALKEAARHDIYSPVPFFLGGEIKLAGRRYLEAIEDMEKVEELCPGFETSRPDLWLARQLQNKAMGHDACMAVFEANNEEMPVEQRLKICQDLMIKYPRFAEACWRTGKMLVESDQAEKALEAFQKGLAVAEENDVRSRLLRDIAVLTTDEEEKCKYLKEAVAVPKGNRLAQAMCRYMLRQKEPE